MYNVLLVDDEQLELEAIQQLVPWKRFHMQIAEAVNDGYSALKVMDNQKIDVVFTDIRMPGMSGLDLVSQLAEKYPAVKTVIMSGYEDFHYAKTAIRYNVSAYLLKSSEEKELLDGLAKVQAELEEEKEKRKYVPPHLFNAKDKFFDWLTGKSPELLTDPFVESLVAKYSGKSLYVAIAELDDFIFKAPSEQREITEKCRDILDLYMNRIHGEYWVTDTYQMILVSPGDQEPLTVLDPIMEAMKQSVGLTLTVGLGPRVSRLDQLANSFQIAQNHLSSKLFLGKNRIIDSEVPIGSNKYDISVLDTLFERLFNATLTYELVQIHDDLEELFDYVYSLRDKINVFQFAVYVISKIDAHLKTLNMSFYSTVGLEFKEIGILYYFETIDEIKTWLRKKCFEISEIIKNKQENPKTRLVNEIKQYAAANIHKNLSLKQISSIFNYTPNYLGQLFKQETGEMFNDFLIRIRMEKAEELLRENVLKVYEIADQIGYNSMTYFCRHFKQYFGMTPNEYRAKTF